MQGLERNTADVSVGATIRVEGDKRGYAELRVNYVHPAHIAGANPQSTGP